MVSPMSLPYTIIEVEQGTSEWLRWCREGIGASDAPTVMGENPWKSVDELLEQKRGIARDRRQNPAIARGVRLEPEARKRYEKTVGVSVRPACLQSSRYDWLRASLDGLSADGRTVVEIKCGEAAYRKTASSGEVPDYYYGQLQHILAVTGNSSIDFWCSMGMLPSVLDCVDHVDLLCPMGYVVVLRWYNLGLERSELPIWPNGRGYLLMRSPGYARWGGLPSIAG